MNTPRVIAFVANTVHAQGPHGEPPILAIAYNEQGYSPIYTRLSAAELNERDGISAEVAEAFEVGSMFGWTVPGAKPARDWHFAKFGTITADFKEPA